MPSSKNSTHHGSQGGNGGDLERQQSVAPLKLIAIPLDSSEERSSSSSAPSQGLRVGGSHHNDEKTAILGVEHDRHDHHLRPPIYKRRTEANTTELFFDLFFVANLTVFSRQHEVDDGSSEFPFVLHILLLLISTVPLIIFAALRYYVLFFSILWFTWLQVTLFDARFSADSLFERTCKALHFGVMTGFAVVGPNFQAAETNFSTMQQLTLILLASRVILIVQYTTVLAFTRKQADALIPLVLQAITLAISAAIFIGIYFSFNEEHGTKGQIGWIIVSVAEAFSLFAISSRWTSFSFRHSCLPQRVGLLTLIILGEGIIGFADVRIRILLPGRF